MLRSPESTSAVNTNGEASADVSRAGRGPTKTAAYIAIAALAAACILGIIWTLLAERIPDLTEARFEEAEQRWAANGPASYDMDLTIRGAQPGEVHIEVRDGKVTAMTRDGKSPPERTWETWTVPGQFAMLEQEFALAADPDREGQAAPGSAVWLRADFDSKYGYPRIYHRVMTGGGPEVYWKVTRFEPR